MIYMKYTTWLVSAFLVPLHHAFTEGYLYLLLRQTCPLHHAFRDQEAVAALDSA
jgi:hypothetical protein